MQPPSFLGARFGGGKPLPYICLGDCHGATRLAMTQRTGYRVVSPPTALIEDCHTSVRTGSQ